MNNKGNNHQSRIGNPFTSRDTAQKPPDLSYLYDLADGDENFVNEVLTLFITEAPQSVQSLMVYLKSDNYTLLKVTVHKLKSSLKMMGNEILSDKAQEMENCAEEPSQYPLIAAQLPPFIYQVNKFIEGLQLELQRRNSQSGKETPINTAE